MSIDLSFFVQAWPALSHHLHIIASDPSIPLVGSGARVT